jgi:hypothetical protein
MPTNTASLAEPGFLAGPSTCGRISQRLTELIPGNRDTVIMDLLSNNIFMGTCDDGMPLPRVTMGDGMFRDHLFPLHCRLSGRLQSCDPIATAVKNSRVILIGPSAVTSAIDAVTQMSIWKITTIKNMKVRSWGD